MSVDDVDPSGKVAHPIGQIRHLIQVVDLGRNRTQILVARGTAREKVVFEGWFETLFSLAAELERLRVRVLGLLDVVRAQGAIGSILQVQNHLQILCTPG